MTLLFPSSDEKASQSRRSVIQGLLVGSGLAGGGTVVFGAIELIKAQPEKAFKLLETWGPWFFLALFSVWAANGLMNRGVDVMERLGDRFADGIDKLAVEQARLAVAAQESAAAAQQSAEKDNRENDRMSTQVEYSAQQSREAVRAITDMTVLLNRLADRVEHLAAGKGGTEK